MAAPRAPACRRRDDMDRNRLLLAALRGHARADLVEKPALKRFAGFDGAATDDERVGIEDVDHLVEEQAESVGLHLKDSPAHRVAAFGQPTDALGRLVAASRSVELVVRIAREKIRKQRVLNRRQRAQRLEVPGPKTIALRTDAFDAGNATRRE